MIVLLNEELGCLGAVCAFGFSYVQVLQSADLPRVTVVLRLVPNA